MKNLIQSNRKSNELFFRYASKIYDKGPIGLFLKRIIEKTVKEIKIKDNSIVLDAGCGTGNLLHTLSKKHAGLKLYGIDLSKEMLKIARRKLNKSAKIRLGYIDNINKIFEKNKFDYIFCVDALHHFPNQEKIIKNFYKLIKKGGQLIITDFDFGGFLNKIFHLIEPGNSKILNKREMKDLFIEGGFRVKKQKKISLFSIISVGEKV